MKRKAVIVFNGPPGCGKGTVIKLLAKEGLIHRILPMSGILMGMKNDPTQGTTIADSMSSGNLVPDEITIPAFFKAWESLDKHGSTHLVLDGVVRTESQACEVAWKIRMSEIYSVVQVVLEVPIAECRRRLLDVRKRNDDSVLVVENRFRIYQHQTRLAIERFSEEFVGSTYTFNNDRDPTITALEIIKKFCDIGLTSSEVVLTQDESAQAGFCPS